MHIAAEKLFRNSCLQHYALVSESRGQPESSLPQAAAGVFATTHWSVVLAAGQSGSVDAIEALEELCRAYWYPLYAYLRRRGYGEHDAKDLTQGFLTQLLERRSLETVRPDKGKFRSFLLASIDYFLADERDRARAQKRGGGRELLSLDLEEAEGRYLREAEADQSTPEVIYEKRWAMTLLDRVLARLSAEFAASGKSSWLAQLQPFLVERGGEKSYREVARETGSSEEAVKKAVQRMRRRYYELFREEIAQIVASPAEVEDELRHLCDVLSR
jgi:RNA polymerase sigma-70 factor (ECF subfamily)